MKTSPTTMTEYTDKTRKKMDVVHDNYDDVLKFDDNDFVIDKNTDRCDGDLFIGKDIAEGDVYDKEVPFSEGLNGMQRNAVALNLGAIKREYASIDRDDQHAVNDFWHRKKDRIFEDHGFMSKDLDTVMDVLKKNVESQSDLPGGFQNTA